MWRQVVVFRQTTEYLHVLIFLVAITRAATALAQTAGELADVSPASQQLTLDLIPNLIEIGADLRPTEAGMSDDVLTAVNTLRRQDGLPRFDRLNSEAAAYVVKKLDAVHAQRARIIRMQYALSALGFDPGPIDGYSGPRTTQAAQQYQQSVGLPVTGELTDRQIEALEQLRLSRAIAAVLAARAPDKGPQDSSPLTTAEIGTIRQQIEACWQASAEARADPALLIRLHLSFNDDGTINAAEILNDGNLTEAAARLAADSALRAVSDPRCNPFKMPDKPYEVWKDVKLMLSPSLLN